jgi:hypothetical protein
MKSTHFEKALIAVTFVAACMFLGRAAVYESESPLDPVQYTQGHSDMPFQGRFMMVPVVRFLLNSPAAGHMHLNHMSSVAIGFSFINGFCLVVLGMLAAHLGRILGLSGDLYYLPTILTLLSLAFTYCIHQEWGFYFYYDFPACVFFALGFWAIISRRLLLYLAISAAGMLNKETVLLLVPLWAAWSLADEKWGVATILRRWRVFAVSLLIVGGLLLEKHEAVHLFGYDRSAVGFNGPWEFGAIAYLHPWHLPQVLSALGFAIPFAYLYRGFLPRRIWCLLVGMLPGLCVLFYFGVPIECRVYGEFAIMLSLILSFELEGYLCGVSSAAAASL